MRKILAAALIASGLFVSQTSHALEVVGLGGLNFAGSDASNSNGKAAPAFGALVGVPFIPMVMTLDFGVLVLKEKSEGTVFGITGSATRNAYQIPVVARFTLLPVLSAGAGVYYQTSADDVDVTLNGSNTSRSVSVGSDSDFGLVGNVRADFPIAPAIGFVLDFRYDYGFHDQGGDVHNRSFQTLAGLRFGI